MNLQLGTLTECLLMPAGGWSASGGGFKYRDKLGIHGPVDTAQIRTVNGAMTMKIVMSDRHVFLNLVPPVIPGAQAYSHLVVGGVEYCGSTDGGTVKASTSYTFRVQNAPAPPACYVGSC